MKQLKSRLANFYTRFLEIWIRQVIHGPIWYTDKYGVTCRLYPEDRLALYLSQKAFFDDEGMLILTKRLLKPNMTVFDVGAHWGAFSLFVARFLGPHGIIHAFEPATCSYQRLKENISHAKLSPQIILRQNAVCNRNDHLILNEFPPQFSAWNTFGRSLMTTREGEELQPTHSEKVRALTLDTYCQDHSLDHIDLLKIDVEGFEGEVMEGCSELLKQSKIDKIVFEISLAPLNGTGRSAKQIIETFAAYNCRISQIDKNGELIPITDLRTFQVPFFANYLAEPEN